jgi:biotin synthase
MSHWTEKLAADVMAGHQITNKEANEILNATGSELSYVFAGAHKIREHFCQNSVGLCSIINAKSGRCAENCAFCAQSIHADTDSPVYPLKSKEEIVAGAIKADEGSGHCYGIVTSGTRVSEGDELNVILESLSEIRSATNIKPSASLGMLDQQTAAALAEAGCNTYHHNLETARSYFPSICTTHDYEEDVETVRVAKAAGMRVCCGGIFGLGESHDQRIELAHTLRELDVDSIPINFLNPVKGTKLEGKTDLTPMDCLRIVAMMRYTLPQKHITVCGGRETNLREFQSWIFMAGADGMMIGNYLTTTGRDEKVDLQMLKDAEVKVESCH